MLILLGLNSIALAATAFAFVVMLASAIDGRTNVGAFTAALTATIALGQSVMAVAQTAGQARRNSFYLPSAMQILDLAKTDPRLEVRPARGEPVERTESGLRFDGVTFRYPGTDRVVLDGPDAPCFAEKVVVLDSRQIDTLLAIPI